MQLDPIPCAAWLAITAAICGLVPTFLRLTHRQSHAMLAAATGIFLGTVFLDLLPTLSTADLAAASHADESHVHADGTAHEGAEHAEEEEDAHGAGHHHHHGGSIWICVLAGLLVVYLFESLALRSLDHDEHHRHKAVAWAALIGLSIQAFVQGLGLSALPAGATRELNTLLHHGAEAFALASIFALGDIRPIRRRIAIIGFAILTPLGYALGYAANLEHATTVVHLATGFAAGIFLFVSLCELLPEVFHHQEDNALKVALLALGIAAISITIG